MIRALYTEADDLAELTEILASIKSRGLDAVLDEMRAANHRADIVRQWLATPTWSASQEFLTTHPQLLSDPHVLDLLQANLDEPVIQQHVGILQLATRKGLAEVYDLVTDLSMAVDSAMEAVESGDLATLTDLAMVSPGLNRIPFTAPYLASIYRALATHHDPDATPVAANEPVELMKQAAKQGSETQRRAGVARLRRLARRHADLAPALDHLASILSDGIETFTQQPRADAR